MSVRRLGGTLGALFVAAVLFGRVTDLTTGQPLTHVTVTVDRAHRATTGTDGSYRIAGLKPGSYTVILQSNDVPPQQVTVTVRSGKASTKADLTACSTTLDYACHPSPG